MVPNISSQINIVMLMIKRTSLQIIVHFSTGAFINKTTPESDKTRTIGIDRIGRLSGIFTLTFPWYISIRITCNSKSSRTACKRPAINEIRNSIAVGEIIPEAKQTKPDPEWLNNQTVLQTVSCLKDASDLHDQTPAKVLIDTIYGR